MKCEKRKIVSFFSSKWMVYLRLFLFLMFVIFAIPSALIADDCFRDPMNAND